MRGTLWSKLVLSYLAIAIIAVGLAAFLFNFAIAKKFRGYVEQTQKIKDEQMGILLGSIYEKDGRWNPQRVQDVLSMWMMSGKEIKILDSQGRQVSDCEDTMGSMGPDAQARMARMGMMCDWGWSRRGAGYTEPQSEDQHPMMARSNPSTAGGRKVPLFVGNRRVGTAVVNPTGDRGIFSAQDRSFQATVNRWLWGVAIGAGGFALVVGLGMARRLSQPLHALTRAAQRLTNGDLTQRVKAERKDEIGQLAMAFNHLAGSLEKQERFRKKLTSDLAHELRTPLTNLQTHIEGLLDGILPPSPQNLNSVHEEILRLGRLVSSLEELTRAEAGGLNLKRENTDLKALVEKIASQFQSRFLDKGVKLMISLPQDPVDASLDPDKISQVIGNLLSNALKFTPSGGKVEVEAEKQGQEVQITVRDTGIGIPEKDIPFIFERFFRGGNGNGTVTKGSGIGLTITKELTEAHGGRIEVSSAPGHGTGFTVRLPLPG